MQKEVENGTGDDDTLYIGSNEIRVAVEKLKDELSQARLDTNQTINIGTLSPNL